MKVERGIFDTVVVYHGHRTSNTKRDVYPLSIGDDLQVRTQEDRFHLSLVRETREDGEDKYVEVHLVSSRIEVAETEIIVRGFLRLPSRVGEPDRYAPRMVILTKRFTGWTN